MSLPKFFHDDGTDQQSWVTGESSRKSAKRSKRSPFAIDNQLNENCFKNKG